MRSRRSLLSGAVLAAAVVALGATSLISTAAQAATPPGLHVSGTQLVEKDGTPFVARGVSHAHTWYVSQTPTAIPAIRAAGANALRVVLSGGDRWTKNDAADVASVIAQCKANKLICMLENHDTTGYGEQSGAVTLDTAANYWVSIASALKGQEDYVQINIGNEPFGNNATTNAHLGLRQLRGHRQAPRRRPAPQHRDRRPLVGPGLGRHHARQRRHRGRVRPGQERPVLRAHVRRLQQRVDDQRLPRRVQGQGSAAGHRRVRQRCTPTATPTRTRSCPRPSSAASATTAGPGPATAAASSTSTW